MLSMSTLSTVRYFIHALRKRLEPDRPKRGRASVVLARRGGYTLNDAEVWIDADEFEAQVNAGVAALAHGERAAAAERFEQALSLYQGDFLADEPYAEWALTERERLRALAEKPLRALSELHADDPEVAAAYLERLAQMEPLDGDVERELLSLWVRQGRLSRAVRHYQAFQPAAAPRIRRAPRVHPIRDHAAPQRSMGSFRIVLVRANEVARQSVATTPFVPHV